MNWVGAKRVGTVRQLKAVIEFCETIAVVRSGLSRSQSVWAGSISARFDKYIETDEEFPCYPNEF